MKPVTVVRGRMLPLKRSDVDTDQIMPKQFLTRVERTGYGQYVFNNWRADPSFVLNDSRYQGANILVTGPNFGSGSSREHAVWGLQQYGFDAIIAPSFSDIFAANSTQMGLLLVTLPEADCVALMAMAETDPCSEAVIDLRDCTVEIGQHHIAFTIDSQGRHALLHGLDDVALTLTHSVELAHYESERPSWLPGSHNTGSAGAG